MMKCLKCGQMNSDKASFCIQCGKQLTDSSTSTSVFCIECGTENPNSGNFCLSCGSELNVNEKKKSKSGKTRKASKTKALKKTEKAPRPSWSFGTSMAILVIIFFAGILITKYMQSTDRSNNVQMKVSENIDPVMEAQVLSIASKFICSCGGCGEESLDTCGCDTAIQEKEFIREALRKGQSKEYIVAAVNSTYGWIKPEFKNEIRDN